MTFTIRRYASAYRKRHKPGEMNKLEGEYALYLENRKKAGQIESWSFERCTFKLADGCRYTPDFMVLRKDYGATMPSSECALSDDPNWPVTIEFHEVKGSTKKKKTKTLEDGSQWHGKVSAPYVEDDALVKLKVFAEQFPFKVIMTWKDKAQWMTREIN